MSLIKLNSIIQLKNKKSSDDIKKIVYYTKSDIDFFIRKLVIASVMDEIDLTPRLERLDRKTIKKCKKLTKMGMTIGGSVLLKACGFLDRKLNDIDVFYNVEKAIENGIIKENNIVNCSLGYNSDVLRYKIKYGWFGTVDIFQSNDLDNAYSYVNGIRFKNPISTLERKLMYFREKDAIDFYEIKNKLKLY